MPLSNVSMRYIQAASLHNEAPDASQMKKMRHFPNSHTYTILLGGIGKYYEHKDGYFKLRALVRNLLSDRRVKPNMTHLNAVLSVASKGNLDLVNQMVERFHEAGLDDRDGITYDILFRAYESAIVAERDNPESKNDPNVGMEHLSNAKSTWQEIEKRWDDGALNVDARLLYSYALVMSKGCREYQEEGVRAIVKFCGLTPFEEKHKFTDPIETTQSGTAVVPRPARDDLVDLEPNLVSKLMDLTKSFGNADLAQHYWQEARAHKWVAPNESMFHGRLRTIIGVRDANNIALATALLEEMDQFKIPLTSKTVFLALQCHMTHERHNLARAVRFLTQCSTKLGYKDMLTYGTVTTISRFINAYRSDGDDGRALVLATKILRLADWSSIALEVKDDYSKSNFLLESIDIITTHCQTEKVRRIRNMQNAKKGSALYNKLYSYNLTEALDALIIHMATIRREFYPDEPQASQRSDASVPEYSHKGHKKVPMATQEP